jgi:hypothetical protein
LKIRWSRQCHAFSPAEVRRRTFPVFAWLFFALGSLQFAGSAQGFPAVVSFDPAQPPADSSVAINVQGVDWGGPLTVTADAPKVHDGIIDLFAHIAHGSNSLGLTPYTVTFNIPDIGAGQYVVRYWYEYVPYQGATLAATTSLTVLFAPKVGLWWNPDESGTGYAFDVKHGVLVATIYSYASDGLPTWYLAFGTIDSNNTVTATLSRYANGQCISCPYMAPTENGNDGTMTIQFTSPYTATMTLPGRAPFMIQPQNF